MITTEYVDWFYKKFKPTYTFPTQKKDWEVLVYLIKKYDVKSVFEIGTWKGDTSLLLWLYPAIERLKTIDIDTTVSYHHPKHPLEESKGDMIKNTNVEMEFVDSMKYEVKEGEQYDMVFIDGNHDLQHITSDTLLALKFKPKIVVWHDYEVSNTDVVVYINDLKSKGTAINQVEGSCVVWSEDENKK